MTKSELICAILKASATNNLDIKFLLDILPDDSTPADYYNSAFPPRHEGFQAEFRALQKYTIKIQGQLIEANAKLLERQ